MDSKLDFYQLLGVDVSASVETIRQAYKREARKWHPDKRPNDVAAEQRFKDIKKAYETLFDTITKVAYDSKRDEEQDNDNNDDDDIARQDFMQLLHGKRISEMYEEKITKWIHEYPQYQFQDNFFNELMNITKTVIEVYEHERTVDCTRHICTMCDQYCNDLSQHFNAMRQVENEQLQKICHFSSLDDLLASSAQEEWPWKPVEPCSTRYGDFWFDPHWSSFEEIIQQILPSICILHDDDFIVPSQRSVDYQRAEQNVRLICADRPEINNLDITFLTKQIDDEFRSFENGDNIASTSYSLGQRICIVAHPDRHGILSHVMFKVQLPPIVTTPKPQCSSCAKSLGFFRRRYRCCMCGENQCYACVTWQTCRHLGYTSPVRICQGCSFRKRLLLIDAIFKHVEQLLQRNIDHQHLLIYIHLLKHYCPSNDTVDQFYQRTADYYFSIRQFSAMIQCYQAMKVSDQSLFKLLEILCSHSYYASAFICFDLISKRFSYSDRQWQRIGEKYWKKRNAVVALLCYQKMNLTAEDLWLKAIHEEQFNNEDKALFICYATWQKQNSKQMTEWTTWLVTQLHVENTTAAAVSTLQLANFSAKQWCASLANLCSQHRYSHVASILRMLDKRLLIEILSTNECTNIFLQLALQMLTNETIENVDKSMMRAFSSSNIEQIVCELAMIHVFHRPDWRHLRNHYASIGQFDRALSCAKVDRLIEKSSSSGFDWIEGGFEPNQPFLYLLESLVKDQAYIELAQSHAQANNYELALNYYLLTLQLLPRFSTVDTILSSAKRYLPASEAFRCYIAVYKHIRRDIPCATKVLQVIIEYFRAQKKPIIAVIAAALLVFTTPNQHAAYFYVHLLDHLSEQYEANFSLINSIHHSIHKRSTSTQSLSQQIQHHHLIYREYLQTTMYKQIKPLVYENIIDLAIGLRDMTSIPVLKRIRLEFFGNRDMSSMPAPYRVKGYLIDCTIDKLEHRHIDAVGKLNEALAVCPLDETITAILSITTDPSFHQAILKDLLTSIQTLGSSPSLQFVPLPLPSSFAKENLLTSNVNLRVIRKYERAILKRLNTNPLHAALSYIDMCQAVHDPTCLVSNWILACLHLYNLVVETSSIEGKEAEVYAYRNLISELVVQSFLVSRVYLPPHMQVYTFRLLLPILLQSTDLFRSSLLTHRLSHNSQYTRAKRMILSEQESQVIQQLLNSTLHLTKVSPLIQLPICLSYDLIYRELVGQRFLVRYLETMIKEDIEQSHLYEYYLFEGVWQGWARDHDFDQRRRTCMETILDTKDWNVYDVEGLLDIPLIPRNKDGWLYDDCRSLVLSGSQRFLHVNGISFDKLTGQVQFQFEPSRKPSFGYEHALFDSIDVKEVFHCGLSSALFTLNQPDNEFHAHPFQEMLYAPTSLFNTQYLATLLHTDYLLKMFTTGTEVCAKAPFDMRPIDETFFRRLPEQIRNQLKPLHKCDRHSAFGRAHRFWIEADDVIYEKQETDSCTLFRVADVRLRVRKHLLIRNSEGKLVDDENESEEEQHSPESVFAKAFTEHYDEIGDYFPELLRLKELLKLSALYVFARAQHQLLSRKVEFSRVVNSLNTVREKISTYPQATDGAVNYHYSRVLLDNGVSSYQIPFAQENELKATIRRQLEEADREIVNKLTQNFCEQAHRSITSAVRHLVISWLREHSDRTQGLAQWIADGINEFHLQLKRPIEQLAIRLTDDDKETFTLKHESGKCNWVPAVFLRAHGSGRRIYGGVNLQLKLVEGNVPRNPSTNAYSASSVLLDQSSTRSSKQASSFSAGGSRDGGNNNMPPKNGWNSKRSSESEKPPHWQRFGGRIDEKRDRARKEPLYNTDREAHRMAKDQNGVPRSAQPKEVKLIVDENPDTRKNGRPNMLRLYTYTNVHGKDIYIRHDTPRSYAEEGGRGAQKPHFNAGSDPDNLNQHYYYKQ